MDSFVEQLLCRIGRMMEEFISGGGIDREIRELGRGLDSIKTVLADAEKRKTKEETVRAWVQQVRDVSYEAEDLLDLWGAEKQRAQIGTKVWPLNYLPCCLRSNRYGAQIKKINESIVDLRNEYPTILDELEVLGRDSEKESLISKLLADEEGPNIVSIVGHGGIGKTTLAKYVYNDDAFIGRFDIRCWVRVSEPFDVVRLAKDILGNIQGSAPNLLQLETVARNIRNSLQGKRFLIVLDDFWTEDFGEYEQLFNSLQVGGAGSAILVTARNESVAKIMGSSYQLHLGSLSEADSWSLFQKIASSFEPKREEFGKEIANKCQGLPPFEPKIEEVGKKIAKKCQGLPLAIKAVGSLLRSKKSLQDWEDVLNSGFWEIGPLPPLMLSYSHLPFTLRRCFSYCALFPRDCVIVADDLIQLWMAQGFLVPTQKNVEMEVIGEDYLQHLAMKSFFQDFVIDKKDGRRILSFKMHDVVRDFACYLAQFDCSVTEFNNGFQCRRMKSYARHLTVLRGQDTRFPDVPNVNNLFTLRVVPLSDSPPSTDELDQIGPHLLSRAASLRVLDLSGNRIGHLPKDISNLSKLKYLNLSHNPISELPESMSELYSLRTLKLSSCEHLHRLPSTISKLVKLRHLYIDHTDSLKTLPKGIGKLASLRMLSKFVVAEANDAITCGSKDLKCLNNLRGCLRIEGLGLAADADEAKKAELQKKIHLTDIEMDFSPSTEAGRQDEVIEALEVNQNLQSLHITSYGGAKLPHWMMKLTNLRQLFLQDCPNCSNFPPLGRLPALEMLHMEGIKAINCLGSDFTANGEGTTPAFPNLEELKISKMENWEEWDVIATDAEVMPRLSCLEVSYCSKLKELPPLVVQKRSLRKLHIHNCPLLLHRYNSETGQDWSRISHIPGLNVTSHS